jgi:hypothetical protein
MLAPQRAAPQDHRLYHADWDGPLLEACCRGETQRRSALEKFGGESSVPPQLRFTPKAGWLELNARAVADGRTIFRGSGTLRGARR